LLGTYPYAHRSLTSSAPDALKEVAHVVSTKFWTTPSRTVMAVSGHPCVLGMTGREAAIVRDRALTTGVVLGLTAAYQGAFPGLDAWSPPI